MNFQKVVKVLLACVLAGALLTGCGEDSDKPVDNFSSDDIKLGMIAFMNVTETKMTSLYDGLIEASGVQVVGYAPKFYANFNAMQLGIEAGEVEEISIYRCVADYMIANNDNFELVPNHDMLKFRDSFCFAVRKDDAQLKADLDKSIKEMESDGTLDRLVNEYIIEIIDGNIPQEIELPKIDGAETIKIGVTGDLPPLDYVGADGQAAGFNTALLAEIAKRLNRNIEIVQIESGARAMALFSRQVDVIFWVVVPLNKAIPVDIDRPEGVDFSEPYFEDHVVHIRLKK